SWRIYYSLTQGGCNEVDGDCGNKTNPSLYPATSFSDFSYSKKYLYNNSSQDACKAPTVGSSAVGDSSNSFCIDIKHLAPVSQLFTDMAAGTLANFSYIEPAFGVSDEHPGSGQSIFTGQAAVASMLNKLMSSPSWSDSVFFLSYDEGGGPYDHVPPVPGHTNQNTSASLANLEGDVMPIAVNPDSFLPCTPQTAGVYNNHCDLRPDSPGANPNDAAAQFGFAAQIGFRVPNMIISPFTRKHYVGHAAMDHTAVIHFLEERFNLP